MTFNVYYRHRAEGTPEGYSQTCFDSAPDFAGAMAILKDPPAFVRDRLSPNTAIVVTENVRGGVYDPDERYKAFGKCGDYRKKAKPIVSITYIKYSHSKLERFGATRLVESVEDENFARFLKIYEGDVAYFWKDCHLVSQLATLTKGVDAYVKLAAACETLKFALNKLRPLAEENIKF